MFPIIFSQPTDVVNYWLRVECSITETPASDTTLEFVMMIEETLPMYFIGVSGILIIPSLTASGNKCLVAVVSNITGKLQTDDSYYNICLWWTIYQM